MSGKLDVEILCLVEENLGRFTCDDPYEEIGRIIAYLETGVLNDQFSSRGWGEWVKDDPREGSIRRYFRNCCNFMKYASPSSSPLKEVRGKGEK